MDAVLRDPTKLVLYSRSIIRDPRDYADVKPIKSVEETLDEIYLGLNYPVKSKSPPPPPPSNEDLNVPVPDPDLSIWSIWAKMVHPSQIDTLIDNLIKVYESDFISEDEYKLRRRELESLLPQNHINKRGKNESAVSQEYSPIVFKDGVRGGTLAEKGKKQKDNVVRVFLSSTFKDMQEEREELVKRAFPRIRDMCAERGLIFKEVDLRWGITEEQATRGDILDICLSEIDNCRPYFINFVGSRYGWVPQVFPPAIVEKFPFLKYIVPGTKSVTEIEIMYGALNDIANASSAFFFLKNVQKTDTQDELEASRLADLRGRVLASTLPCKIYSTAVEFAQQVADSLTTAIKRDYPIQKGEEDEQKITKRMHYSHSLQKSKIYVARNSNLNALDNYMYSYSGKPLLITGDKGIGKSSLVSTWFLEKERELEYSLIHHVGCGSDATDCISMLRRIMQYIKTAFNWNEEIPTDPKRIQRDFARWLQTATQGNRFVLVIDGIDQLTDVDGAHNLLWLPELLHSDLKVILTSASNHRCSKVLSERKSEILVVTGLSETEKKVLAVEYLLSFGKTLSPSQIQLIVNEPQTNNPLYLRLLLEELRIFGNFESLTFIFDHYLRARLPVQLLDKILARLEQDYGQEYPGLVRDVMGLLWASQAGLSENEILDILLVPPIALSSLLCGARELFVSRNGLLSLFHDSLRQAVQTRYLDHDDLIRKYHLMLAGYFESLPDVKAPTKHLSRKAEELPFHLLKGEKWYRLKTLLSNISIFEEWFIKRSRFDLKRFWLALGEHYSVSATYLQALSEYEENNNNNNNNDNSDNRSLLNTILRVAKFLKEMLHYPAAVLLLNKCLSLCDESEYELRAKIYYRIAQNYWNQGLWELAEPPCLESLKLRKQCFGENNLAVAKCLCGLGELFVTRDQKKAEIYLEQSLSIRKSILGENHHLVSRLYHDIAVCKDFYGKFDEAIDLHKRAIQIRNNTLGPENPQLAVSWENLGTTQKLAGRAREAEVSMQRSLSINIAVHGNIHPSVASSYEWLALIYEDLKQPVRASEYHEKSEKVLSELSLLGLSMGERVAD